MQGIHHIIRNKVNLDFLIQAVAMIQPSEDRPIEVKIQDWDEKRTELQNRFLWGWLYASIAKQLEAGGIQIQTKDGGAHPWTKDLLHELFREKYLLKEKIVARSGKEISSYHSTTKLGKKKFSEYVDNIKNFVREFWSIEIPPTNGIWASYETEINR